MKLKKTREYFRQELFFRHRPEIGRVIFIASPLRGSNMATGLIGGLATFLIRESTVSSEASQEMLRVTNVREEELKPKRRANSVDSLSPKSRFPQRAEHHSDDARRALLHDYW